MHPSHAVANIADTRSTEGKAPNKHLNSDLDAACAQPRSFWAGLVPAGLRNWWQERAEKRHLKHSIARLDGLSSHLLSDAGFCRMSASWGLMTLPRSNWTGRARKSAVVPGSTLPRSGSRP